MTCVELIMIFPEMDITLSQKRCPKQPEELAYVTTLRPSFLQFSYTLRPVAAAFGECKLILGAY